MSVEKRENTVDIINKSIKILIKDPREPKYKLFGASGQIDNFVLAGLILLCIAIAHMLAITGLWLTGKTIYTPLEIPTLTIMLAGTSILIGSLYQGLRSFHKTDELSIGFAIEMLNREKDSKKYVEEQTEDFEEFKKILDRVINDRETARNRLLAACAFISVYQGFGYATETVNAFFSAIMFQKLAPFELTFICGFALSFGLVVSIFNSSRLAKLKTLKRAL